MNGNENVKKKLITENVRKSEHTGKKSNKRSKIQSTRNYQIKKITQTCII